MPGRQAVTVVLRDAWAGAIIVRTQSLDLMRMHPPRLIQITDTHLYASPRETLLSFNTQQGLDACITQVLRQQITRDAMLWSGDLVHDGSPEGYGRLNHIIDTLACAAIVVPGNHDEPSAMRRALRSPYIAHDGVLERAGWKVIGVSSFLDGSNGGHVSEGELARLESLLDASPAHHALVVVHHPPVAVGSEWLDTMRIDNGGALLHLLRTHPGARNVVCGHIHQCLDTKVDGIRILASPATCIQFAPGSTTFTLDDQPPGYRWIDLRPDGTVDTGVERVTAPLPRPDPGARGY